MALPEVALPPPSPTAAALLDPASGWNKGKPVFRIPPSRLAPIIGMPLVASVVGVVVGAIAGRMLGDAAKALIGIQVGLFVSLMIGGWLGLRTAHRLQDYCSDPDCSSDIPADASECPVCAGIVSGTIHRQDDRLAAEEALRAKARSANRTRPDATGRD